MQKKEADQMKVINGVNHITINVTDLEESKRFYESVFGLPAAGSVDMGDHTLTYYDLGGGVRLELIDYVQKEDILSVSRTRRGMYLHMCLETETLQQLCEIADRCRAFGTQIRKEPSFVEKLHCCNILVTDPSGVEIEVLCKREEER